MPEKMTTYEIIHADLTKRTIQIPSTWKVTFGPCVPGTVMKPGGGLRKSMPFALRIYESKEQQRAIFTDVASFMDTSIPMSIDTSEKDLAQERAVQARGRTTTAPPSFNRLSPLGLDQIR